MRIDPIYCASSEDSPQAEARLADENLSCINQSSYVFLRRWPAGTEASRGDSCGDRQAFEKAQNGNGQLLEIVGMDSGLAPHPLGFGATSAWVWRHTGLARAAVSTLRCVSATAARRRSPRRRAAPR